jgi:hypothetical protein
MELRLVENIDELIDSIVNSIDDKVDWAISSDLVANEMKEVIYKEVVRRKIQKIFEDHVSDDFFKQLYMLFGLYGDRVLGILYAEMKDEIIKAEW